MTECWAVENNKTYVRLPSNHGFDLEEVFPSYDPEFSYTIYKVCEYDRTSNGIYFDYDLCIEGMLCVMLADITIHSEAEIEKATRELLIEHDIVSLMILKLTPLIS